MTDDTGPKKALETLFEQYRRQLQSVQPKSISPETGRTKPNELAQREATAVAGGDYYEQERHRRHAETQSIKEKNFDMRANRRLRWRYARWVFRYLVWYSVAVGAMVVFDAFGGATVPYWYDKDGAQFLWLTFEFDIPEVALTTLVGSTAVAAIGLVFAVTNGLFKVS